MKIIVTGATGSLGGAIVRHLAKKGHQIIACGTLPEPPKELQNIADYLEIDITGTFELPDADVCIHAAALSDDKAAYPDLHKTNVDGTLNVMKATTNCPHFVYVSSSSVYVPSPELLTEEDAGGTKKIKLSLYGKSKWAAENLIRQNPMHKHIDILRPRALYGPGDKMILPRMLKMEKNGALQVPGGLIAKISMTHYENFNHALDLCLATPKAGIRTYNISDSNSYVLIDVMRKFTRSFYGKTLPEKKTPIALLKFLAVFQIGGITPLLVRSLTNDMVLNIDKIKTELGYNPKVTLDNSLPELKTWVEKVGGPEQLKSGDKSFAWK